MARKDIFFKILQTRLGIRFFQIQLLNWQDYKRYKQGSRISYFQFIQSRN